MFSFLTVFAVLSSALYMGVNWFLRPTYVWAFQYLPHLSLYPTLGLSAVLTAGIFFLGKHRR